MYIVVSGGLCYNKVDYDMLLLTIDDSSVDTLMCYVDRLLGGSSIIYLLRDKNLNNLSHNDKLRSIAYSAKLL